MNTITGKSFKILIIAVVGLLIIGGITRFHHHSHNEAPCFCLVTTSSDKCHHPDNCNTPYSHENQSEESCPLHIDFFKLSEHHDPEFHFVCCNIHCDICSPIIFSRDNSNLTRLIYIYKTFINYPSYNCEVARRGPPYIV